MSRGSMSLRCEGSGISSGRPSPLTVSKMADNTRRGLDETGQKLINTRIRGSGASSTVFVSIHPFSAALELDWHFFKFAVRAS